jgi:hypothetical protein
MEPEYRDASAGLRVIVQAVQTVLLFMLAVGAAVVGAGAMALAGQRMPAVARVLLPILVGVVAAMLVIVPQGDTIPDEYEPTIEISLVVAVTLLLAIGTILRTRR